MGDASEGRNFEPVGMSSPPNMPQKLMPQELLGPNDEKLAGMPVDDDILALTSELVAIRRKSEMCVVLIRVLGALGAGLLVMTMIPMFLAARTVANLENGQQTTINELRDRAAKQEELLKSSEAKIEEQNRQLREVGKQLAEIREKLGKL